MNIYDLHSAVWEQLNSRRAQLPHALLISGQRGLGKFDLARSLSESLLCENPSPDFSACQVCSACTWMKQGNHPDFRLVQPEALSEKEERATDGDGKKKPSQQITIDQVRGLDDFLHVGTHRHGMRIVLINPAEAMNRSAANSILKALEEPIASTLFILVSCETDRLLPTIRSRCQSVRVRQPADDLAEAWLREAGVGDAQRWLALAGGAPVLAVELAVDEERALLDSIIAEMACGDALDPLSAAANVDRVIKAEKRAAPLKRMVEWSQKWLFDLTMSSEGLPVRYFLPQAQSLTQLASLTDSSKLLAFARKTIQYRLQCEQPLNSRLFLEDFFLSYAALFRTT